MRFLCLEHSAAIVDDEARRNGKCMKNLGYFSFEISLMIAASALRNSSGVTTSNVRGASGFNVRASESSVAEPRPG
jgi:hypothetical protein